MKVTTRQLRRIIKESLSLNELWGKAKWEKALEAMEAQENIETVGDLLDLLQLIKNAKTDEQGTAALKDLGMGMVIDLIPMGGSITSIADLLKGTYNMPDDKRTGTGLDYLDVDDEVAAIVDDPVENLFLADLIDRFEGIPPETRLEKLKMTDELSKYLAKEFDARTVVGFSEGRTLKVSKRQLRGIIKESLLKEQMLKIISNPYSPETETFNRIANYALNNDIAGAMADPEVNTDELYWELDEMRPWVNRVGSSEEWCDDDCVVPDRWDADAVYDFMGDLEKAWHDDQAQKDATAVAADPDKDWLEFLEDEWTSTVTPKDLETLGWKEYKRYIRLSPPESISHAMGEIHVTNDAFLEDAPGTREEFVEFLTRRAGKNLKKRKIYRSPPPIYD